MDCKGLGLYVCVQAKLILGPFPGKETQLGSKGVEIRFQKIMNPDVPRMSGPPNAASLKRIEKSDPPPALRKGRISKEANVLKMQY